jgi:hypothetical protein
VLEETNASGLAQANYIYLNGRRIAMLNGSTLYYLMELAMRREQLHASGKSRRDTAVMLHSLKAVDEPIYVAFRHRPLSLDADDDLVLGAHQGQRKIRPLWCDPIQSLRPGSALESRPAPAENKVEDHDHQDQVEGAAAVVADARTHVITTPANQQQQNDQNDDEHRGSLARVVSIGKPRHNTTAKSSGLDRTGSNIPPLSWERNRNHSPELQPNQSTEKQRTKPRRPRFTP